MKNTKFKKSKIVTWILFILTTMVIVHESVVTEDKSLVNQIRILSNKIVETLNPPKVIPVERIEVVNGYEEVQAGKRFTLKYKVYPEDATDKSVIIKNQTPEVISFNQDNNGIITNNDLDQDYAREAKIEITSQSNPDIKVTYDFDVVKYKPQSIYVSETNLTKVPSLVDTYEVNVNEDIYMEFKNEFSDSSLDDELSRFDIVLSDNLKELNSHYYYATKPGDAYIKAICNVDKSIYKEVKFKVNDLVVPQVKPDEARFRDIKYHEFYQVTNPMVGNEYEIKLYKDGKPYNIPFEVTSNNQSDYYVTSRDIYFFDNGLCKLDFYLPTLDEHIYQEFYVHHNFKEPDYQVENDWDEETSTIGVEVNSANTIDLLWAPGVTATNIKVSNSDNRYFKVDVSSSRITIKGKEAGSSSFYIIIKQNETSDQDERKYKINVNVRKAFITDQDSFDLIIRKSFGHMLGFLIDGFLLGLLIYLYSYDHKPFLWMLLTLPAGFIMAGSSELLQMIPKRGTCWKDVGIDYFGWFNGFLLILIILLIVYLIRYLVDKQKQKN